jgi:hypothetical protein
VETTVILTTFGVGISNQKWTRLTRERIGGVFSPAYPSLYSRSRAVLEASLRSGVTGYHPDLRNDFFENLVLVLSQ